MTYITITTRCNMNCPHCCNSCTSKGEDMSFRTFKKVIDECSGDYVAIGGGEPTLHPRFWDFIIYALARCEGVWLATNGSKKEIALTLSMLAKKEVLGCELSLDEAHDRDMVDNEVVEAFEALPHGIRDVFYAGEQYRGPIAQGRALENYSPGLMRKAECVCNGPVYMPNGDVKWCGCTNAPVIGNVYNDEIEMPEGYYDTNECYNEWLASQDTEPEPSSTENAHAS